MALFNKKDGAKKEIVHTTSSVSSSVAPVIRSVVRGAHVTEKSLRISSDHQYVFDMDPKVSKQEAAKEIEKMYKVQVIRSQVVNKTTRKARFRGAMGGKVITKKIIVTLAKGQQIDMTGNA